MHVNCEQGLRRSTAKIKVRWEEESPSGEGSGVCGLGVVTLGTLTAGAPAGGGTWKAFLSAPGMGGWRIRGEGVAKVMDKGQSCGGQTGQCPSPTSSGDMVEMEEVIRSIWSPPTTPRDLGKAPPPKSTQPFP